MRRPQQDGQKALPLHEKATSLFWPHVGQTSLTKALGWNTAFEELTELPLDEAGNAPVLLPFARKNVSRCSATTW